MAKKTIWNDDYWLYVMQLYMRRPVGVKPLYSKAAVELSLELHVHPKEIMARQRQIESLSTKRIERIWDEYGDNPKKLSRAVRLLRSMQGFGSGQDFYKGVEVAESFEPDFRPINGSRLLPITFVIVLDLYYRLTPITMVAETPEVVAMARLTGQPAATIAHILQLFLHLDPFIPRKSADPSDPLLPHARKAWQQYGNADTDTLAHVAENLKAYYVTNA